MAGHHCACGLRSTTAGLRRHLANAAGRGEGDVHYAVPPPQEPAAPPQQRQPPARSRFATMLRSRRPAAAPPSAAEPTEKLHRTAAVQQGDGGGGSDVKDSDCSSSSESDVRFQPAAGSRGRRRPASRRSSPERGKAARLNPGSGGSSHHSGGGSAVPRQHSENVGAAQGADTVCGNGSSNGGHAASQQQRRVVTVAMDFAAADDAEAAQAFGSNARPASPSRSWVQIVPDTAPSPPRSPDTDEPYLKSAWGPHSWAPSPRGRRSYDATGAPSPRQNGVSPRGPLPPLSPGRLAPSASPPHSPPHGWPFPQPAAAGAVPERRGRLGGTAHSPTPRLDLRAVGAFGEGQPASAGLQSRGTVSAATPRNGTAAAAIAASAPAAAEGRLVSSDKNTSAPLAVAAGRDNSGKQTTRRSRAGVVTRAVGRQLRGMRDAAVAAASPRLDWAAVSSAQQLPPVQWSGAEGLSPAFPPEAVEAVLLWADPWLSARVFGVGLYALICLRQLASGALPLQPATAAAAACLLWLGASLVMRALRRSGLLAPLAEQDADGLAATEAAWRFRAERGLVRCAAGLAPVASACTALLARRLSGRDKVASFWLALALWAVAALSESRLSGQPGLLVGTWVGLFTLTPAYAACRRALDTLAEELLGAAATVLASGGRATLGLAGIAAAAGWAFGGPGAIGQATCAAVAAAGAVAWRACAAGGT